VTPAKVDRDTGDLGIDPAGKGKEPHPTIDGSTEEEGA
jgi:hypothetical protein